MCVCVWCVCVCACAHAHANLVHNPTSFHLEAAVAEFYQSIIKENNSVLTPHLPKQPVTFLILFVCERECVCVCECVCECVCARACVHACY